MSDGEWVDQLKFPVEGFLIPAIVQDVYTGEVLMLAYMNREALERTLATGRTWFWSRSRGKLWLKGESSGHFQSVRGLFFDCDSDTLLVKVEQTGVACHEGYRSCFYREAPVFSTGEVRTPVVGGGVEAEGILTELSQIIDERKNNPSPGSYTSKLFAGGQDKILKKISEEAGEVILASKNNNNEEIVYEAADLIFHLLVMLRFHDVAIDQVLGELKRRRVTAKAQRTS